MSSDPLFGKSTDSDKFEGHGELHTRQIGRYILQDRLGSGGTATVYQAYDQVNGQSVALKVLPSTADANTLERFRREAMTSGGLRHPHIVRTIQVGVASHGGDIAYIAMELIDGESLGQLLTRRGRLHPEESCGLLAPIANALGYAHSQGIVHRDVKPSNILLKPSRSGNPNSVQLDSVDNPIVPMLSDFGIARALDAPDLTASGRTVGTPAYMAPEQCRGGYDIDGRADIYALTAVLFRCLVGRQPFLGNTPQILHAHVYEPLKIEDDVFRRLSPLVVEILQNGMAKKPKERYSSAQDLAAALAEAAGITLMDESPAPTDEIMPTVTLPSIETVGEQSTISETIIIPVAQTADSLVDATIDPPTSESRLRRVDGLDEDGPPPATSSATKNRTRPTIKPPNQTTETMASVHILDHEATAERVTWAQRLERIRWAWVAFASVALLFIAGALALLIGGYLTFGNMTSLFGETPTAVPVNTDVPISTEPLDNNATSLTATAVAGSLPIVAPDSTSIAQLTEEAQLTLTMTAAISATAAAESAAATETALFILTRDANATPRFLTSVPAAPSVPTSTPRPIVATPTSTALPPVATSTPSTLPTSLPTATFTPAPPTPTWTPNGGVPATVEPTTTPTKIAVEATLVSTETPVAPTDTPAPTETPVTPTETPAPTETPLIQPTPTWTAEAALDTDPDE